VVVDETSMVALTTMARLLEAVRPTSRLVLVGDPDQLASVEAGAVLGDIVGPAPHGANVVLLRKVHRYRGAIATLAEAVQRGDAGSALDVLAGGHDDVRWLPLDVATAGRAALRPIRDTVVEAGARVAEAAAAGRGREALVALGAFRLLCAHRLGPYGVSYWTTQVERWLGLAGAGGWYAGRPLLVTENDYGLGLYNGDSGVVVAHGAGGVRAVFERRGQLVELTPQRLPSVDTVYAMTVHKAQGSQFDEVAVLLPDAASPILTRELLYTAITRARGRLMVVGTEEAVRAAAERPITRASGLRELLRDRWDAQTGEGAVALPRPPMAGAD
jgi:exodeoxyribonuclease V alpha subunit